MQATRRFFIYAKKSCPRRSLESTRLYKYLIANGLIPVNNSKKADLIFIYTCGGFNLDEKFSILSLEKSLKTESAKTIVTGCLTKINPNRLRKYSSNITLIPPDQMGRLDTLISAKIPYDQIPHSSIVEGIHDLYHGNYFSRIIRSISSGDNFARVVDHYINCKLLHKPMDLDSNTYRVEIGKGCLGNCSYCAIKKAMEPYHSFPPQQIVENFTQGLREGYKKFVLISGDIGCYGVDIGTTLPSLLTKLFEIPGEYKIALIDLNAQWFIKYYPQLLSVLKSNSEKVSKILMPIQSGSDRILRLMNRNYKIAEVKARILDLQRNIPEIRLDTHIIVGFPGETEEDFRESVNLVKTVRFSQVTVYRYEDRPSTLAKSLPDKIAEEVIDKRIKLLERETKIKVDNRNK